MKTYLLIIYILVQFTVGLAQSQLKFYHLTREDGLSQSTVNYILQDKDGYFWFCTDDGVNKWNGYDFKHYTYEENNPNSLALGRASTILQDEDSIIWVGSRQGGISKYIKKQDHFKVYQIEQGIYNQNRSGYNYITSMIPFKGNLLVGTLDNGLHYFDKKNEAFTQVKIQLLNGKEFVNPIEFRLYQDRDSTYWLAHSKGVLKVKYILRNNLGKFTFQVENLYPGVNVITVYQDRTGNIWFGTLDSGAFQYNPQTDETLWLEFGNADGKHLNSTIVRCFLEDYMGKLWIGTAGGGINMYDFKTGDISYHMPQIGNKYAVSSNSIYNIYQSPDSNIWVGTYNGGVSYTNWYKQSFNHIRSFGAIGDLNNNSILAICETPDNKICLGTDGGGLNVFDPKKNTYKPFEFNNLENVNVIKSLKKDSKGNVFIGTYRSGLIIYNFLSGKCENISTNTPVKISCPDIWDIALTNDENDVWMATLGEGLIKYNRTSNKVEEYRNTPDSLGSIAHNYLSVLLSDSEENVWIGTFNAGISMLPHGKGREFKNYRADTLSRLSSNEVFAIYEDSKGNILVGAHEGGLNILNKRTNKFVVYRNDSILPASTVQGIIEDNQGYIWLSTDVGLVKLEVFNADSVRNINHFAREGLFANEFNQHSVFKTNDGKLYFGGVNGYNSFMPESIPHIETIGQTVITDVFVFDKKIKSAELQTGLRTSAKGILFEPWQSTFSFEYALMDYTLPELNTYQFKLEGFDKDWVNAGSRRRATYTNIDAGTYTFRVRGINSQGIVDKTPVSFVFTVKSPFYRTAIFKFLILVIVIALIIFAYRIRLNVYIRQENLLKKMVGERTSELVSLNKVLENQNDEINKKSNELKLQQQKLLETNKELQGSYKKIENQNSELEKHRNHLEEIVKERTLELEVAKRKAEESERLKMAFLSNMSHEIRTPMNAIIGFASLLGDEYSSESERLEYIKQVNTNSDSLLRLIDDILDLSKIEANQLKIQNDVFELKSFVNDIFYNWQRLHEFSDSEVVISYKREVFENIYLFSDAIRIRQIIYNLLDNAFKFTHQGEIVLSFSMNENNISISVKDTGIGIDKEGLLRIFNRFHKIEKTDKKLYRGAGLGLTISHRLAEMLGGNLSAVSEPGVGSTFYLRLPTSSITSNMKSPAATKEKHPITQSAKELSVLVAEDEEANFIYLKKVFSKHSTHVDWAKNGKEAVEFAKQKEYDIILMDIKMPVMDGIEATGLIRKEKPNQLIFAQTAFARTEEIENFKKQGFDEYFTKPLNAERVIKTAFKYFT